MYILTVPYRDLIAHLLDRVMHILDHDGGGSLPDHCSSSLYAYGIRLYLCYYCVGRSFRLPPSDDDTLNRLVSRPHRLYVLGLVLEVNILTRIQQRNDILS